jgi:hypothetical protein
MTMKPGYAIFLALIFGYAALLVVSYWAGKFGNGLSGKGLLLTFLLAFIGIFLLCLLASTQLLTTALIAAAAVVFLTLLISRIIG